MNRIEQATEYYNNDENEKAEALAIEEFFENPDNKDAVDILSAVFLKTNRSTLLMKTEKKYLYLIRRVAIMLDELNMYPHAMVFFKKAVDMDKDDNVAYNSMGSLYEAMNNDEMAKKCYEKSMHLKPEYAPIYNLGILYKKQRDVETAIRYVKKALQLKPDDWQTEYSLGMLYFMKGDFEEGYKHFLKRRTQGTETLKNNWDGTPHKEKTILVFCDYGFGDAIMYSRYFPYLLNMFKTVKICCRKQLEPLFKLSFPDFEYCNTPETDYDYSVLAMNLPYYLKMDFEHIPSEKGYLKADENKVQEYKEKYFNTDKKKIGLFWIGGEKTKRTARTRMMALHQLKDIIELPQYQFYSFQIEDPFEDIKLCPQIVDLGKTFNDFSDTAAAMKNLDLMISIDSSVIHLAGALGVKSYLMLPKASEWRWFQDEKHTVWYDSVELFMQKTLYDWSDVTKEIYNKLK